MYKITKETKLPQSAIEFEVEISKEAIESKKSHAVKHLSEHISIPGFRKGKVPENMVIKHVGEMTVLEESAEEVIKEIYPKIVEEKKIFPLGYPKIAITSIAIGSDVKVIIKTDILPSITLPGYKKIASKVLETEEKIEVTEKEIEDVVNEIKKFRAKDSPENTEITDDFVQTLGDFKTVDEFKAKVKENLTEEKKVRAKEKKRSEIIEAIAKDTKAEIPETLIEEELNRMTNEFSHELSRFGSSFENYKKETNKTDEQIRSEWKERAEKRVKNELILMEIAREEKIKPEASQVEKEVKHLEEHYPDAEKSRLISFVEEALQKEAVFKFLEDSKDSK